MRDTKEALIQSTRMDGGNAMDAVIDGRLNKSRYELLYTVKTVAVHIVHSVQKGKDDLKGIEPSILHVLVLPGTHPIDRVFCSENVHFPK